MPDPTYTIRGGDSLRLIATRFGTTLRALVDANAQRYPSLLTQPGHIQVGWTLTLPAGASGGAPGPAAPRSNDDVLYVGMNPGSPAEARALRATGAKVTAIHDAAEPDQVRAADGQTYDLSTREGAAVFAATFGLPPEQTERVADALYDAYPDARDELGQIAQAWAPAERGGTSPSRLVLSGHSVGHGVWGDENGTLTLDSIDRLGDAMPIAVRRVEDIHVSGCYSGGQYAMERLRAIFPRVTTIWAYAGTAPAASSGAAKHEQLWEHATRGSRTDLDRAIAARTAAGENVAVWTITRGYHDGHPPLPLSAVKDEFVLLGPTFDNYFSGEYTMPTPRSGPLRDYYNALQAYLQHPECPANLRPELEARRDVTIRLIYYAATVAPHFAAHHADAIRSGFAAVQLPEPDFAALPRGDALETINAFADRVSAANPAPEEATSLLPLLQGGLVELQPQLIPDAWV